MPDEDPIDYQAFLEEYVTSYEQLEILLLQLSAAQSCGRVTLVKQLLPEAEKLAATAPGAEEREAACRAANHRSRESRTTAPQSAAWISRSMFSASATFKSSFRRAEIGTAAGTSASI